MPKPANAVGSVKVVLTTTPQVRSYLEQLVQGGLYGKNRTEAAERLLTRSIEALIRDGVLKRLESDQ